MERKRIVIIRDGHFACYSDGSHSDELLTIQAPLTFICVMMQKLEESEYSEIIEFGHVYDGIGRPGFVWIDLEVKDLNFKNDIKNLIKSYKKEYLKAIES